MRAFFRFYFGLLKDKRVIRGGYIELILGAKLEVISLYDRQLGRLTAGCMEQLLVGYGVESVYRINLCLVTILYYYSAR